VNKKQVEKLRCKEYAKVIQVNVPTRFYWTEKGFDGVEFGPIKKSATKYQLGLLDDVIDTVLFETGALKRKGIRKTEIPDYIIKAFKDDDKEGK
jgi:hypothetical protein